MEKLLETTQITMGGYALGEKGVKNALYIREYLMLVELLGVKRPETLALLLRDSDPAKVITLVESESGNKSYPSITI